MVWKAGILTETHLSIGHQYRRRATGNNFSHCTAAITPVTEVTITSTQVSLPLLSLPSPPLSSPSPCLGGANFVQSYLFSLRRNLFLALLWFFSLLSFFFCLNQVEMSLV